jgi:hypothetical protein
MMRLARVLARQPHIAVMLLSRGFVMVLYSLRLGWCGRPVVMVGVNFLLRMGRDRADCESTKR